MNGKAASSTRAMYTSRSLKRRGKALSCGLLARWVVRNASYVLSGSYTGTTRLMRLSTMPFSRASSSRVARASRASTSSVTPGLPALL